MSEETQNPVAEQLDDSALAAANEASQALQDTNVIEVDRSSFGGVTAEDCSKVSGVKCTAVSRRRI